jgi:hypothetical protein
MKSQKTKKNKNKFMWLLTTLMVIFFASTCALAYACYNLIKKIEIYEDWLEYVSQRSI